MKDPKDNKDTLEYDRAQHLLRAKSFLEKARPLMNLSGLTFGLFAVLSAATGFAAYFDPLKPAMPILLAGVAAAALLAIQEAAEALLGAAFFTDWYARKAASHVQEAYPHAGRFAAYMLVFGVSAAASAVGAYHAYHAWDATKPAAVSAAAAARDSTATEWNMRINALDSTKTAYFAQNSWRGKLKNNAATAQFNAYETELSAMRLGRDAAMKQAAEAGAATVSGATQTAEQRALTVVAWVLLLSGGKLAHHWFRAYYAFRLVLEATGRTPAPAEKKTAPAKTESTVEKQVGVIGFATATRQSLPPKGCANCGQAIVGRRKDAKFCGANCKTEHQNLKKL